MRISAKVEVLAEFVSELIGSVFFRLVKAVNADLGAVVLPLDNRIKMVKTHGLCL